MAIARNIQANRMHQSFNKLNSPNSNEGGAKTPLTKIEHEQILPLQKWPHKITGNLLW